MTNAAVLDRHQAHIFYLSKFPVVFWQPQIYNWMKKLATEIEMLQEKEIYDIHWDWYEQSISFLITKQHPTEDFYPVPSKSRLYEICWEQKNVKKLTLAWLHWFKGMELGVFYFTHFNT